MFVETAILGFATLLFAACVGVGQTVQKDEVLPAVAHVVRAEFHSVWDSGEYNICTMCDVNLATREVYNIEAANDANLLDQLHTLDEEYLVINGQEYAVYRKDDIPDDGGNYFFYD